MNNTQSLQDIFHDRIFQVPDYQRGYAWGKEHVQDFLEDLALLSSTRRHYTGTIVLYQPDDASKRQDSEGTTYSVADIVDGQQRLTTIVLLLNEISRALNEYVSSRVLAEGIRKKYVQAIDADGQPLLKLSVNKDTNGFFKSSVLSENPDIAGPQVKSGQRLLDAKTQIADYLRAAEDEADREQWLRYLLSKVTTQLHFNVYEVGNVAEVGVIFEVMNDRGKPLTDMEKVKNYLLYVASSLDVDPAGRDDLTKAVNNAWAEILRQLMAADLGLPSDEDRLLRAHWIMQYDCRPREWDGSKSIRRQFDLRRYQGQHTDLLNELHKYVAGLRNACTSFCDALKPDRYSAFSAIDGSIRDGIKLWNSKFTRIGATANLLPLLMAVRMCWPSHPKKYLEIVQLCEQFAFRVYRVGEFRTNFGQSALYRVAYDVAHGAEFAHAVYHVKHQIARRGAHREFDEFWAEEPANWWYEWSGLKYFLYEYESHLAEARGATPKVNWAEVSEKDRKDTIEHILPQSIETQPSWKENFSEAEHVEYVHNIGNLALTKHNSHYSNKPFTEKKGSIRAEKPCYTTAPFYQEQELAQYDDWTAEAIDERRAKLFAWAQNRWRVDFSDLYGAPPAQPDEDEENDPDDDNPDNDPDDEE